LELKHDLVAVVSEESRLRRLAVLFIHCLAERTVLDAAEWQGHT
jgi:hypothetical protein